MEQSSAEFNYDSFILFCLDEEGNIAFEASPGKTTEQARMFAAMLCKIFENELTPFVLEQLKTQLKNNKRYKIISEALSKEPEDLAVDPIEVEIV
jgi:hypothetical protein